MKKLPIGIQRFRDIIQENYLYVDKTKQIYELISQGKLYFLSRPRRFGKSLLISTLQEIFKGNKDLFEGLYIAENTDYAWVKHPVLSFNFATLGHKVTDLDASLKRQITLLAHHYDIVLRAQHLSDQIEEFVSTLSKKQAPVVFLVDEYDKPIVDFITDLEIANKNRATLGDFFSPLKNLEHQGHIRFLFITGVSKFSKVSIFSDLNNLVDLTLDPVGSDLVGITNKELKQYFDTYIQEVNQQLKMPEAILLEKIKSWYDGYSYDGETFLYNPFSLLNFFRKKRFGNFWFATGTPTFLVEHIRKTNIEPMELEQKEFLEAFFDRFTIEQLDIYNLLFQTGYLTIKSTRYDDFELRYKLGYPNREVQQSFIYNLLEAFTFQPSNVIGDVLLKI